MNTKKISSIVDLEQLKTNYNKLLAKYKHQVLVCSGAGCVSSNCGVVRDAFIAEIKKQSLENEVKVLETGCMGTCAVGPVALILPDRTFYTNLTPEIARNIIKKHILNGDILTQHTFYDNSIHRHVPNIDDIDF